MRYIKIYKERKKEELQKEDIDANLETVNKVLRSCRVCHKKDNNCKNTC
jgi:hypothetical protein